MKTDMEQSPYVQRHRRYFGITREEASNDGDAIEGDAIEHAKLMIEHYGKWLRLGERR